MSDTFASVPVELKTRSQWVCWTLEPSSDGKPTKKPKNPKTCQNASTTNPSDWTDFDTAVSACTKPSITGIGYVFSPDDGLVGVDIDNCRDSNTGQIAEWAWEIIRQLDTYAEVSPSQTGVKLWLKAEKPKAGRRCSYGTGKVETYGSGRYFTVTGQHVEGTPTKVEDRPKVFTDFYSRVFSQETIQHSPDDWRKRKTDPLSDDFILQQARQAKNGEKFRSLFDAGDVTGYTSDSEANLALCSLLAFWTGPEGYEQVDRLFRRSALMRDKWERPSAGSTWGRNVVLQAYTNRTDYYPLVTKLLAETIANGENPLRKGMLRASEMPPPEEIKPLWFGLYPGKLTLVNGETGAGKSSLFYNIAIHAALNQPLYGIKFGLEKPLNVLYIDPENGGNSTVVKLERIGKGRPDNLIFHDGMGVNFGDDKQVAALHELITEERIDLLILDPIANLFGTGDENNNAEAARQMKALTTLTRETGVCIVAIHHTGKNTQDDYGRGASARLAAADVGVVFRCNGNEEEDDSYNGILLERNDLCRLQITKNRIEGRASLYLKMAGSDQFEITTHKDWKTRNLMGNKKETKAEKAAKELLIYLDDGDWYTRQTLVDAMKVEGIGMNNTDEALDMLEADGRIEGKMNGKAKTYRLKPSSE